MRTGYAAIQGRQVLQGTYQTSALEQSLFLVNAVQDPQLTLMMDAQVAIGYRPLDLGNSTGVYLTGVRLAGHTVTTQTFRDGQRRAGNGTHHELEQELSRTAKGGLRRFEEVILYDGNLHIIKGTEHAGYALARSARTDVLGRITEALGARIQVATIHTPDEIRVIRQRLLEHAPIPKELLQAA